MGPGCSFREVIMGIRGRSVLLFALVLSGAGQALAQDAARAAVERAIEAHGGMRRLSQLRADRVKIKGSLILNNKTVEFTGEMLVQLPGQLKSTVQLNLESR